MKNNKSKSLIILIIVVVIVAVAVFFAAPRASSFGKGQWGGASQSWYAVHLNNGQVYFGHMVGRSRDTITIADTHYLEAFEQKGDTVAQSQNFALQSAPKQIYQLIARGNDKTLTTDHVLHINKAAVLFWEKLTEDSDVVKMLVKEAGK